MLRKFNLFFNVPKHGFCSTSYQLPSSPFPPNLQTMCSNGHLNLALTEMSKQGLDMNFQESNTLLNECVKQKCLRGGQRIHAHFIKTQYHPPVYLSTRLIVLYTKCECLGDALRVLDEMPERNVVSWTAMISGYSQRGYASEALNLLVKMLKSGTEPNEFTFATVLTSCTGDHGFDHGRQVHNLIIKRNFESHLYVGSSLLDMYAKTGKIHEARRVFEDLPERDVVSCTAVISGYAQLGLDEEALELFRKLQREGCSHGKMVEKGLEVFDEMMSEKDGVLPDIEHYGCVVDLLGRAGKVKEAFEFIKNMPFEPTAAILGSLLGACRVHLNVDVGELVGYRLLEVEPENAGNYVILSNLFASAGKWEDVGKIRELMKEKTVVKEPGRSWIAIDQTLHTFHAGDRSHPRKEEISKKVKEISLKFKEDGYCPDLSCVLYDVDEEQKEKILLGHSEKLALAFGLICTPNGKPIRIMKNLRVCVDCHNFAKFVSKVYQREVFLRDKTRFHHIVRGVCSCGDYW